MIRLRVRRRRLTPGSVATALDGIGAWAPHGVLSEEAHGRSESVRDAGPTLPSDRLGRFLPALLALTALTVVLEAAGAALTHQPALAAEAATTSIFVGVLLLARHELAAGRPARARATTSVGLSVIGAVGAWLVSGVGPPSALMPALSVALMLPYLPRHRVLPVTAFAVGGSGVILLLAAAPHLVPPMAGPIGAIFGLGLFAGVLVFLLVALADYELQARDFAAHLRESTRRHLEATTTRLSIVAALAKMRRRVTPEATAAGIANALSELPLVDVAMVLEVKDAGLSVLAEAGETMHPLTVGEVVPEAQAEYLLDRSADGAWAELLDDRPGPGLQDEKMSQLGIQGHAFAPIYSGENLVGLVGIATADGGEAARLVADLPSVSEAAAVASALVAPALEARHEVEAARARVAEVIRLGAFHPVFQPIVDLGTGLTIGFEALTRFTNGQSPDRVFADGAQAGLGADLEAATLGAALRDAGRLPAQAWLSVNVSPAFLADPTSLQAILAQRSRPIVIELTEHEIIADYPALAAAMRTLGSDLRLAVDDAGAGVANFQHLVELRPQLIKIDAGLIRGANTDLSRQALIVGLIHFAEMSGALVLAEGIETEAERDTVTRLGVTLGQGYLLGRPAPVETWASSSDGASAVT